MHALKLKPVEYPERDGKPMADNTRQAWWIVFLYTNLNRIRADFVAMDLLWYPVEGNNRLCAAPAVMVAIGRPKGHRGCFKQWEEGNRPPEVVFEILSPGNTYKEMDEKLKFYESFSVQEYYIYDPDENDLAIWIRQGSRLVRVPSGPTFQSPLLGIRFDMEGELRVFHPDGEAFLSFDELTEQREAEARRAEAEARRAEAEHQRAERLAAKLKALGIEE
jgi:Uma2 family endonuclease